MIQFLGKMGKCRKCPQRFCVLGLCVQWLDCNIGKAHKYIHENTVLTPPLFYVPGPSVLCAVWAVKELGLGMPGVRSFIGLALHICCLVSVVQYSALSLSFLPVLCQLQATPTCCNHFRSARLCFDYSAGWVTPDFLSQSAILPCHWHFLFYFMACHFSY